MRVVNDTPRQYDEGYDRDGNSMFDSICPSYEDSVRRIDVERYIFRLSHKESIVLTFRALGFKSQEIRAIMKYRRVDNIYQILSSIRGGSIRKEAF